MKIVILTCYIDRNTLLKKYCYNVFLDGEFLECSPILKTLSNKAYKRYILKDAHCIVRVNVAKASDLEIKDVKLINDVSI